MYLQADIEANDELVEMKEDIEDRVQKVLNQAYEYTLKFEAYAYLWEEDRQEYLSQFLKYGHQLGPDEIEAKAAGEEPESTPATLEQFKEAVCPENTQVV